MKGKNRKGFRRLELRSLADDDNALIGLLVGLAILIGCIFLLMWVVANIVPIIIFLVVGIIFALVIKHLVFGRRSIGVVRGAAGLTKEVGREFVPMARQAGGAFGRLIGR